jgi:hypothetical protein
LFLSRLDQIGPGHIHRSVIGIITVIAVIAVAALAARLLAGSHNLVTGGVHFECRVPTRCVLVPV